MPENKIYNISGTTPACRRPIVIMVKTVTLCILGPIILAFCGCKSEQKNILPVIQLTDTLNHQFTYTNKISGFYLANTHTTPKAYFDGWTVNEHHYLYDYQLFLDNLPIARDSLKTFNYYPDCFRREYSSGLSETFTMLDSLNALVWELDWIDPIENIVFNPLLSPTVIKYNLSLSKTNRQLLLSPAELFGEHADADMLWLELTWNLLNEHRLLIVAVLGENEIGLQMQSADILKNYPDLGRQRRNRMLKFIRSNAAATNIMEINDALAWAQLAADALVTRQRGEGIWAGLPWFNNYWGRDTFISFNGVLLQSGQFQQARKILENFVRHQQTDENDPLLGRIPNRITNREIIYNTADGTWWFVRAAYEYLLFTGDQEFAASILPVAKRAIEGALKYKVDKNFFITHGDAETWMDAQHETGAWSPRGNRAVEIQVLWYTALQCAAQIAILNGQTNLAEHWLSIAGTLKNNFTESYYSPVKGQLYDHLNSDDSPDRQIRPNQIFGITAPDLPGIEPLLPADYQIRICNAVLQKLTYRYGVASLWQEDDDFHPWHHYESLYPQDAAYHNGTVWTWLAGPVISSLAKFHQQDLAYRLFYNETHQILEWDAIGNYSELLDALPRPGEQEPHTSGTVSQAWSLAGYITNFYQDFIGFRPDALQSSISFEPHIPYELNAIQVQLPYKNYRLRFVYQELEDQYTFRITCAKLHEKINISLKFPGYDPIRFSLEPAAQEFFTEFSKDERYVYQPENDLEWYFAQPELRAGLPALKRMPVSVIEGQPE
jgi:glycogen debranching enzyme